MTPKLCLPSQVPSSSPDLLQFAGRTLSLKNLVLVSVLNSSEVVVRTESIVIGSMVLKEIKAALEKP